MKSETLKNAMSEEMALNELEKFINEWVEDPEKKDSLQDSYKYIFQSLISGNLVIDENLVPVYTLIKPILNDAGDVAKAEVNFKTRITPTNQARLAKGLNISLDQLEFMLICISHIIGEPKVMIDKFSKKDYNTIREIAQVFI